MPEELSLAIQQVCEEKGLSIEVVKETIEDAIAAAFRKDFGDKKTQNIRVDFDLATGKFEVFDVKEVVEDELKEKYDQIKEEMEKLKKQGKEISEEMIREIQDKTEIRNLPRAESRGQKSEIKEEEKGEAEEEKRFNPRTMIGLSDAKAENKKLKVDDELIKKLEVPAEFGRMAAQTAKQVIIQKLREAERNTLYEQYKGKIGDLIVGTVQRQEGKVVLVDLGNVTALVLPPDQVRVDNYQPGARMKFYVKSVEQTNKGPEVLVSRSHPVILRKLFKLEVPEINAGTVQIKAIARDAGFRAKIAVTAKEENLDPIGAAIGQRGTRVQTVINELGGEKIDIIKWDENLEKFIINALAPAKILRAEIDEESRIVKAYVKEDQYSLAIGKAGQNVRLAAQLVGMKIDVVMEKEEHADETLIDADNADEKDKQEEIKDIKGNKEIEKQTNKEIKGEEKSDQESVSSDQDKKKDDGKKKEKKENVGDEKVKEKK